MLRFREHRWLLDPSASHFQAYIPAKARSPEAVIWTLTLHYVAGGAVWRRVSAGSRPRFSVKVNSFHLPGRSWTDLARLDFWNRGEDDGDFEDEDAGLHVPDCGMNNLIADYSEGGGLEETALDLGDYMWRVASRDGPLFTIEMAGITGEVDLWEAVIATGLAVAPGDPVPAPQPEAPFWKECAEFYLLEAVPFGTVTVRVPRNANDVEAYALTRARQLLDVPEPEKVEVIDFTRLRKAEADASPLDNEYYVNLYFHGYWKGI